MSNEGVSNIHATAIVVGSTGLLFLGPSGCGKSMTAFACLTEAPRLGLSAFLVSDDQVFISQETGRVVASVPPAIAGLIELRGTGLVRHAYLASATMHYAVLPGAVRGEHRMPPEGETVAVADGIVLPVIRLLPSNPVPLASLMAFRPDIGRICP